MKQFIMIFRNRTQQASVESFSKEQMQTAMKEWQDWITSIAATGNYIGTNRLFPEGKVIQQNIITDGGFAEGNIMVAGYLLVKANSLDEAVEMATKCPNLVYGLNVEVRSVMPIEFDVNSGNFLDIKN